MKELIKQVEQLAHDELQRANKKSSLFNSTHEGLGVIEEEIWEVAVELKELDGCNDNFKRSVYKNHFEKDIEVIAIDNLRKLKDSAIKSAGELIQVAAMCDKFELSLCDKSDFDWDGFKNGEFCVRFDCERAYNDFLNKCYEQGLKWTHFGPEVSTFYKDAHEEIVIIADHISIMHGPLSHFENKGAKVIMWRGI